MKLLHCDFCNVVNPTWRYPTKPFATKLPELPIALGYRDYPDWAACDECSDLIEHGDIIGLAKRAAEDARESLDLTRDAYERIFELSMRMHNGFREHRKGPRIRIGE